VFESAIVPKWKDGVITFKNVFVSRRPGQLKGSVKKGSSDAAAEAAALRQAGHESVPVEDIDDGNYTQFDITIGTVNVTLSFLKWWNGTGLLRDVEVKGVRGVVDRTSVNWTADGKDPLSYRHEHNPGDFELEHFKMEDLLVTVYQPKGFRPFAVSIYSCELPQLRRQWLFYDFLSATHMSGSYDGSLFTIHPRQMTEVATSYDGSSYNRDDPAWKKMSRLRIDALKIDHLNRGLDGPFGWIYEGNVDLVADVMFPEESNESIGKVMAEFYDKMEEAVTSNRYIQMLDTVKDGKSRRTGAQPSDDSVPPETEPLTPTRADVTEEKTPAYFVMDLRVHLNDVRAAVPLFNNDISYINQALVRPIVAYINAKRTYIPISCRIVKRASDFDGAWTVWECGMMDDVSAEVYSAFARNVEDQQTRVRRLKRVGLWTMSLVVHALLAGVAGDLM
jgi:distribution and morphology protein 31